MTHLLSALSPEAWPLLRAALSLGAGVALGLAYFSSLRWSVRLFTAGGRMRTMIALSLGRLVLLGGVLALASLAGALPLLLMAAGVMGGRAVAMRRFGGRAT